MRGLTLTLLLLAASLAACDHSPAEPRIAARKPDKLLFFGSGWSRIDLPFAPYAINDAGTIVGVQDSNAVVWQNGTLTVLPRAPGITGVYAAVGITPQGKILGWGYQLGYAHALYWLSPSSAPYDVSMDPVRGYVAFSGVGMTDDLTIVGTENVGPFAALPGTTQALRWTPSTGFTNISPSGTNEMDVVGISASGYAGGWMFSGATTVPLRWDPSGVPTTLYSPSSAGATPTAMDEAGDIVGVAPTGPSSTTTVWHLDGTVSFVSTSPAPHPTGISNAGRIIGYDQGTGQPWTYYNGSLTWVSAPYSVTLRGVNTCGSYIGTANTVRNAGSVWVHSGIYAKCDAPVAIASLAQSQSARDR